jgi:hypothetical protein
MGWTIWDSNTGVDENINRNILIPHTYITENPIDKSLSLSKHTF